MKTPIPVIFLILGFISCKKNQSPVLFRSVPSSESGITFSNALGSNDSLNIIEYLYYYNGGGVAIGDVNNDGLPDVYLASNQNGNKLYLNKGHLSFEDVTVTAGVSCQGDWNTGISMADVNQDGWLDLYVCQVGSYKSIHGRNQLFINNHDLTFTERAMEYNLDIQAFSTQAGWLDYDRDGDLDMYLLCHSIHSTDTYRDTSIRHQLDPLKGDKLFRNDNNKFIDVTVNAGILSSPIGYGLGISIADFNNDAWPDVLIGNDFHENDYLYINQQNGTFAQSQTTSFGHTSTFSMGSDVADINNDGIMDLISLDMKPDDEVVYKNSVGADPYDIFQYKYQFGYHFQYPRNTVQLAQYIDTNGIPYYSEIAQQLGLARTDWSWTPLMADFDLNGLQDVFIANGITHRPNDLDYLKYFSSIPHPDTINADFLIQKMPDGRAKNFFFSQSSPLKFEDYSFKWNPEGKDVSTGAAYGDLDDDGDVDLIINKIGETTTLLENRTSGKNYLKIQLLGEKSNSFAVGSKITVHSRDLIQSKQVFPVRGFQSSSDYGSSFGIPSDHIDSVVIIWPDGLRTVENNVLINSNHTIHRKNQPSSAGIQNLRSTLLHAHPLNVEYGHKENFYNDFEREKLLINKLSTQGPGVAVGDVNGDGLNDLWLGGARGQSSQLYLQSKNGFQSYTQVDLDAHAAFEDVDGVFFDADGDQDLDLMVASGGNQIDNQSLLIDRLYINNGQGEFTYNPDALPDIPHMSACLAVQDIDDDKDLDVFIGGRVGPYYGFNTDSYLLINDGKGIFTNGHFPVLKGLGLITDAVWSDIDSTCKGKELILVGEWMPITILKNKNPGWQKEIIKDSEGYWQCIETADLDGNNTMDLIAGNMGLNHPWQLRAGQSIDLYTADFDQNTSPECLISYPVQNKIYSFFSKDELTAQMVGLRKKYTDYNSFAQSTFKEIFSAFDLSRDHKKLIQLQTGVFYNQGISSFTFSPLPPSCQSSIIFSCLAIDLNKDGQRDLLLGGNLYETLPSFGRFDASYGHTLINELGKFRELPYDQSGFFVGGAIRDIKSIVMNGQINMLVIRNDAEPILFSN